jgi:lipoprotein NlpI
MAARWYLLRAYRLSKRNAAFEQQLAHAAAVDPNYPPLYLEAGLFYRDAHNYEKALEAMNTYLLLAPNYADSSQVRQSAEEMRKQLSRFR